MQNFDQQPVAGDEESPNLSKSEESVLESENNTDSGFDFNEIIDQIGLYQLITIAFLLIALIVAVSSCSGLPSQDEFTQLTTAKETLDSEVITLQNKLDTLQETADEIESLRAQNEEMRQITEQIKPVADLQGDLAVIREQLQEYADAAEQVAALEEENARLYTLIGLFNVDLPPDLMTEPDSAEPTAEEGEDGEETQ